MFEFALVTFAILFFFLINAIYTLFVAPLIEDYLTKRLLKSLDEKNDWTGEHTESALNLDKNN